MTKKLGLTIAAMATAVALLAPGAAMARDRDDRGRDRHEWREHEQHERHEAEERRERRYRGGYGFGFYAAPSYGYGYTAPVDGYYDRYGNFHPYARGYYDRWGRFHRY